MGEMRTDPLNALRDLDRARYIATLFTPDDKRQAIAALYAMDAQIARIRALVSEPLPGEIRLQWWRDALSGEREHEATAHPIAGPLLATVAEYDLPLVAFNNYFEARIFDLYDDPLPDQTALEGYLGETQSILFQMVATILGDGTAPENGDASGHAGVALGVARILSDIPAQRARGQTCLPLSFLLEAGADRDAYIAGRDRKALDKALKQLIDLGERHLAEAQEAVGRLPQSMRAAFVPIGLCGPVFKKARKAQDGLIEQGAPISALKMQWSMMRFAARL